MPRRPAAAAPRSQRRIARNRASRCGRVSTGRGDRPPLRLDQRRGPRSAGGRSGGGRGCTSGRGARARPPASRSGVAGSVSRPSQRVIERVRKPAARSRRTAGRSRRPARRTSPRRSRGRTGRRAGSGRTSWSSGPGSGAGSRGRAASRAARRRNRLRGRRPSGISRNGSSSPPIRSSIVLASCRASSGRRRGLVGPPDPERGLEPVALRGRGRGPDGACSGCRRAAR